MGDLEETYATADMLADVERGGECLCESCLLLRAGRWSRKVGWEIIQELTDDIIAIVKVDE